jgi:hypothetical protein
VPPCPLHGRLRGDKRTLTEPHSASSIWEYDALISVCGPKSLLSLLSTLIALLAALSGLLALLARRWLLLALLLLTTLRVIALLLLSLIQFLFVLPVHWLSPTRFPIIENNATLPDEVPVAEGYCSARRYMMHSEKLCAS